MTRTIHGRAAGRQLAELLQNLLAAELLAPGPYLFLHARGLADTPVLDNRLNQFRALLPEASLRPVRLGEVLLALLRAGTEVWLAIPPGGTGRDFARALADHAAEEGTAERFHWGERAGAAAEGVLAADYYLAGPLSFTPDGVMPGSDPVQFETGLAVGEQSLTRWRALWDGGDGHAGR
jgi:hypothetical protein